MKLRSVWCTALALSCFAGNSLLCRLALATREVDAATFTVLRLLTGSAVLTLLAIRSLRGALGRSSLLAGAALFAYAAPFSYAYLQLGAALGALVLFGSVQMTMLGWSIFKGERPRALAWLGMALAFAGLVGLTLPGRAAPGLGGTAAMLLAGGAWGVYSLRGRRAKVSPVPATAANFLCSLPWAAALLALGPRSALHVSARGALLAAISGAVTSGLGYALWYAALPALSALRAAVLQLLVPVLAACGAIAFLGEQPSLRLAFSGSAILGGVALTLRRATRS